MYYVIMWVKICNLEIFHLLFRFQFDSHIIVRKKFQDTKSFFFFQYCIYQLGLVGCQSQHRKDSKTVHNLGPPKPASREARTETFAKEGNIKQDNQDPEIIHNSGPQNAEFSRAFPKKEKIGGGSWKVLEDLRALKTFFSYHF